VIVTSKRVLPWVTKMKGRTGRKWYIVGENTRNLFLELVPDVREEDVVGGKEAIRAQELAKLIVADTPQRCLFLCGDKRRPTIVEELMKKNIPVRELVCYKTITRDAKEVVKEIEKLPELLPKAFVFFSPSGLDALQDKLSILTKNNMFVAIGQTTAKRMKEYGISPNAIAPTPNAEGVAQALLNIHTHYCN